MSCPLPTFVIIFSTTSVLWQHLIKGKNHHVKLFLGVDELLGFLGCIQLSSDHMIDHMKEQPIRGLDWQFICCIVRYVSLFPLVYFYSLKWEDNFTIIHKKTDQRLFFLRQLRGFGVSILQFYKAVIHNVLTYLITVRYGNPTANEKKPVWQSRTNSLKNNWLWTSHRFWIISHLYSVERF